MKGKAPLAFMRSEGWIAEAWTLTRRWPGVSVGLGTVVRVRVGAAPGMSFLRWRACIVAIVSDGIGLQWFETLE